MEGKFTQGGSHSTRKGRALVKVCSTIPDPPHYLTRSCPKLLHIYSLLAQAIVRPSASFKLCSSSHRFPSLEWVVPALGPNRYAVSPDPHRDHSPTSSIQPVRSIRPSQYLSMLYSILLRHKRMRYVPIGLRNKVPFRFFLSIEQTLTVP